MPTVAELIGLIQNPGDDGVPDTIYDDVLNAHTEEITSHVQNIESANEAIKARDAEISRLKSANYDLMISVQGTPDNGSENEPEDDTVSDAGIDDLF